MKLTPGLYFVSTPIGTARDITLRTLDILASADVLAAEDTRSLRKLMEIHGVPMEGRSVLAYHDHSGAKTREKLLAALAGGKSVAYASEAGTPLIADPGYDLSRAAAEAGHMVTSAPGPSAILAALTLAGLPTDTFLFCGFLPNATKARRARLEELRDTPGTLVTYESPKRLADALKDMAEVLGCDRQAAVCRELTKKFEEIRRGTLGDLAEELSQSPVKGEVVIVIDRPAPKTASEDDIRTAVVNGLLSHSVKDTAELVANAYGIPKRRAYQMALELGKDQE